MIRASSLVCGSMKGGLRPGGQKTYDGRMEENVVWVERNTRISGAVRGLIEVDEGGEP